MIHRASYCTKSKDRECNEESKILKYGFAQSKYGLETIMRKYSVDVYFAGHTHHYERTWPVFWEKETQYNYINPIATVHVLSGIGGVYGEDEFEVNPASWTAYRDEEYRVSYSRVTVHNDTHLTLQQVAAIDGSVFDEFTIVQNNHKFP